MVLRNWVPVRAATAALLLLLTSLQLAITQSDVAPPLSMGEPEVLQAAGEATLVRERRGDSYGSYGGGGGYGGGGMSYGGGGGGGGYGCSCPYVSCDSNNNNGILAFGVGALLGLLLAMLRAMAAAPAPAPAPGRRFGDSSSGLEDHVLNVTWSGDPAHGPPPKSSLMELLHLPAGFGEDIGPMMSDMLHIYTSGNKHPECMRRWICEAARQAQNKGGVAARLGSFSSIAYAWYTKDLSVILQNILPGTKDVDCKYLSPKCELSFMDINY